MGSNSEDVEVYSDMISNGYAHGISENFRNEMRRINQGSIGHDHEYSNFPQGHAQVQNSRTKAPMDSSLARLLQKSQASQLRGETAEDTLVRLFREADVTQPRVVVKKKDRAKIKELVNLKARSIRVFLCQVAAAEQAGQDLIISCHINAETLDLIYGECVDLSNDSIKAYLQKLDKEEMDTAQNQPAEFIRSRVKWNTNRDMTNEEKLREFISKLKMQMRYVGNGAPIGTIHRERVMQEVVKMLPSELMISSETVTFNQKYQSIEGLQKLIENRLPLLNRRQILSPTQEDPTKNEKFLTNKLQQFEPQMTANHDKESMPARRPAYLKTETSSEQDVVLMMNTRRRL